MSETPTFADGCPADVFFLTQVASKQRPTLLGTQVQWTALACQGQAVFANMPVCSIKPHAKSLAQGAGAGSNVSTLSFTRNKCGSQAGNQKQVLFRGPSCFESESGGRSSSTTPTCSTMFLWGARRCLCGLAICWPVANPQKTVLKGSNHGQLSDSNYPNTKVTQVCILESNCFF